MRRNKADITKPRVKVVKAQFNGRRIYIASCARHKKRWTNMGALNAGTHNGAHIAAAAHQREHDATDAKRAAKAVAE